MVNKVLKYLNNSINQEKLFNSIDDDIREICKPYEFKKVFFIRNSDVGEITLELQDPIPTKLIKQLDKYMGIEGVMEKAPHNINLIYKIEKGF